MSSESSGRVMRRRTYVGLVTGDKMEKTIVVSVERLVLHPVFHKYIRRATVVKAHDEAEEAKVGDRVEIVETRPLSKTKRFRLVRIVAKAPTGAVVDGESSS
jgi:small subunit ribosomal protein S17